MKVNIPELIEQFLVIQKGYKGVYRATVKFERYNELTKSKTVSKSDFKNHLIREQLLEHVGHLPIIATFFHPFLKNTSKVDLGRTLKLLAIHDIGEIITGDILTHNKFDHHKTEEDKAAKKLLSEEYYEYFLEFAERSSLESKYANSVDKLSPLLHDMEDWETAFKRWELFGFRTEVFVPNVREYMAWDNTLEEVWEYIVSEIVKAKRLFK